ncbi:MAG: formylglycine-generating enzyme family protein [Bacteroidia bacterium]|nr:MAG: formylglycine-generating enzyme family protein [Bacteroidia bacterium]
MKNKIQMVSASFIALIFCILFVSSCASVDVVTFEREPEYIYGTGSGQTKQEANESARNDLIASALAETQATQSHLRSKPIITSEMARSFNLPKISPYTTEKKAGKVFVVLRLKRSEWKEIKDGKEAVLRSELTAEFGDSVLSSEKTSLDRLNVAVAILSRLYSEGLYSSLTTTKQGSILFSDSIIKWFKEHLSSIQPTVMLDKNFINNDSVIKITFLSADKKPIGSLPLSAKWKVPELETEEEISLTDSKGIVSLKFPNDSHLKDKYVTLVLTPAFSKKSDDTLYLKSLDTALDWEFQFRHFTDIEKFFINEIEIPGGEFTAGAVEQDKRAELDEEPRKVTVRAFSIDKFPVTNGQYRVYLEDMKISESEYPDFWDDSETGKENHPVVGVSQKEAQAYAEWLNTLFNIKKRLPTEDEWEKAARGGMEGIYPWGDESPKDNIRANFNGNNRYDGTSPVGSFKNGVNAFGLFDMAGNVWEWTSTSSGEQTGEGPTDIIVKGGSWMDGPNELRVSNRKELDPSQQYGDVGFRLVREALNE